MKCPYNFSIKSRRGMTEFLLSNGGYSAWRQGTYPLEWDAKVRRPDMTGRAYGEGEPVAAALDEQWEEYLNDNPELFWHICEDAARTYLEDEYTSYPGADQGDWRFHLVGRSGGHLVLASWRGYQLEGLYEDSFEEFLNELSFPELRALYRGVVCLDKDVNPDLEFSWALNFHRVIWEESMLVDPLGLTPWAAASVSSQR